MPPKPKIICVACEGRKKSTSGRTCPICKGTGRKLKKVKP